jgi:hypothetical protein
MKTKTKIFIAIGAFVVAALNSPWLIEGDGNNCAAQERLGYRLLTRAYPNADESLYMAARVALSDGRVAANIALEQRPYLPPSIGCAYAYWRGKLGLYQINS